LGSSAAFWQTTLTAGRFHDYYGGPDPTIDPDATRHDRRWRFGVSESFALGSDVALIAQAQRDIVSSSLPNFAHTNWSFLIGPQFRF
jgi:hypothetical protein